MSIDLTEAVEGCEAVEAAARALYEEAAATPGEGGTSWADLDPDVKHTVREAVLPLIVAATPAIEAAVRTQVTAELHEGGHHHAAHATRRASFWEGRR